MIIDDFDPAPDEDDTWRAAIVFAAAAISVAFWGCVVAWVAVGLFG